MFGNHLPYYARARTNPRRYSSSRRLAMVVFCFVLGALKNSAWGAAFSSTQTGSFNIGTTWGKACAAGCTQGTDYPGSSDSLTINSGHVVTVTATPAQAVIAITINNG